MKIFKSNIYFLSFIIFSLSSSFGSDVPFPTYPEYISKDTSFYSTGAAYADFDGNGLLDLVFSNGNDMASQSEVVYYNYTGFPETSYNWISRDFDYSGHLAVGDLDNDGDLDLAIGNFIDKGPMGQFEKTFSKIYFNIDGMFENQPSWQSSFSNNSFSVALGDVDGDGDLDIAFANGQPYEGELQKNTIYRNNNGVIEQIPFWYSEEEYHTMDLVFGDFNNDGLIDLAYANVYEPITIHYNTGSGLSESPSWVSSDIDDCNSITTGDFNNDGFIDLAVTTMTSFLTAQRTKSILPETGASKIYLNNGSELETSPSWISYELGKSSSLAAGDVDGDGDTDLAVGGWFEGSRIYLNDEGSLHYSKDWLCASQYNSVAEAMQFDDVDNDGLTAVYDETKSCDGTRKVFYLNNIPTREIIEIIKDGKRLQSSEYLFNPELGFIQFNEAHETGDNNISISYIYSKDLDLLVSNWDPDKGNYIFFNTSDDNAPPYVKGHNPPRYSKDVSPNEAISFIIADSKSGVDETSFTINSNLDGTFEKNEINGDYLVQYNGTLPEDFKVEIEISASDKAAVPNIMPLHTYTFQTSGSSEKNPPVILMGGFMESDITEESGGILTISAMVKDPDNNTREVEIYYDSIYIGFSLFDDGMNGDEAASDGIFTRIFNILPGVPANSYLFSLIAVDNTELSSTPWPFLTVKEK